MGRAAGKHPPLRQSIVHVDVVVTRTEQAEEQIVVLIAAKTFIEPNDRRECLS